MDEDALPSDVLPGDEADPASHEIARHVTLTLGRPAKIKKAKQATKLKLEQTCASAVLFLPLARCSLYLVFSDRLLVSAAGRNDARSG